jgi:hypothetical protein
MSGPGSSSLQTQSSVAHAALLNSLNKDLSETRFLKSELRGRQRRAALVGEAYIVAPSSNCQHAFPSFLNFLRQTKNPQQTIQQNPAERPKSSQHASVAPPQKPYCRLNGNEWVRPNWTEPILKNRDVEVPAN